MPEYIEREAFESALKDNHDAIMQDPTYGTQRKWWEALRYNRVRSILSKIPAADVAEMEAYDDLREAFVDFVCSGVHNPAPYCKNRRSTCVDKRGWCTYNDWCNGFNPDGRKG